MIHIRDLAVRNFMSVGNATQGINFDRNDLTLVLGENLDLGGDGSRNGTGKTTIINALSYALYGNALSNIRKDNLVNKTNSKHMFKHIVAHANHTLNGFLCFSTVALCIIRTFVFVVDKESQHVGFASTLNFVFLSVD